MRRLESTVVISKPIGTVWKYINDEDSMSKWLDNFVKYEHVSGEKGAVGSRGKHYYKYGNRDIVMDEEILEMQKPNYVKIRLTGKDFEMIVINTLEEKNKKTELVAVVEFIQMSLPVRLMTALQPNSKAKKDHERQLETLKQLIEDEK